MRATTKLKGARLSATQLRVLTDIHEQRNTLARAATFRSLIKREYIVQQAYPVYINSEYRSTWRLTASGLIALKAHDKKVGGNRE